MANAWNSVFPGGGTVLQDAMLLVWKERKKRPDNWLHENMATRQHQAYELFAQVTGGRVSDDTAAVNRAMYEVLCRETHAHPRLDSFGIQVDQSGERIRIDRLPRDLKAASVAIMGGTEMATMETVLAVRWQRVGAV